MMRGTEGLDEKHDDDHDDQCDNDLSHEWTEEMDNVFKSYPLESSFAKKRKRTQS